MIDHQDAKGTLRELTVHDSPPQNGVSECGMCTQAELARALLIASGLPRFLWEEAMKHVEWVKERSLHSALDGKTPYKMKHQRVPHLGGIHKFGAAAYVKDLKPENLMRALNLDGLLVTTRSLKAIVLLAIETVSICRMECCLQ